MKEKILEISFDDDFIKNVWNYNDKIDLVKELFGDNYKESF